MQQRIAHWILKEIGDMDFRHFIDSAVVDCFLFRSKVQYSNQGHSDY